MIDDFGGGGDDEGDDPDRDCWLTPRDVCQALGRFELDPCCNPRAHTIADRKCMLERGQDGLAIAKLVSPRTRVFLNTPFSRGQVIKWVLAYRHTRFCYLLRLDPSTQWYAELHPYVSLMLTLRERRFEFEPPPGADSTSDPFPHVLLYRREEDATDAILRMCYAWAPIKPRR